MEVALNDVPAIVEAYFYTIRQFAKLLTALAEIPLDETTAKQFLVGFLYAHDQHMIDDETPQTEIDKIEVSTRRMNQVGRMIELFKIGKGNKGENFADLFQGMTDYYTHESAGGDNVQKQIDSSEFGNAAAMKSFAYVLLGNDKRTASTIKIGKKILIAHEKNEKAREIAESKKE
jgi:hypothetical protein